MPSRTSSRRERSSSSSSSSSSWNPLNLFCPGRRRRRMRRKQRQQLEALHRHFGDRVAVESSVMDSSETTVPVRNPPLHHHASSRRVQDIPRSEPVEQSSSLGADDEMNPQVQERLWDIWKGYQHRVEEHRKSKRPKQQQPDEPPRTTREPMAAATSTTNSAREVDQPQDMTVFLVQQRAALKAYQELQQKQQRSRQAHSRPSARPRSKPLAPVMEENALVPFVRSPTTPRQYHEQIPHVVTPTPSPPGRMDVDESVYSYPDSDSVYISSHGGAYSYPQEGSMSLPSPSIACCEDASQDKMSSVTLPWDLMGEDEKPAVSMNVSPASSSESMVSQSTMSTLEPPPSMFSSFGRFLHGDDMEDSAMDSILSAKPPPPQTSAAAAASGYSHDTTDYSGWFSALQPPRFGRGQSIGSEGLGPQMPLRAER